MTVELRQGHALDLLQEIKTIDLLATDPPYAFSGEGAEHAISATVAVTLREAGKKLRIGHWAVVFCASSWRSTMYMVEALRGVLEPVRIATWHKPEARTKVRVAGWRWATVNVIAFRKGPAKVGYAMTTLDYIIAEPVKNGRRAELPEAVCTWALSPFCCQAGLMLDPFAGSNALAKAAHGLGMNAIGFEIKETA